MTRRLKRQRTERILAMVAVLTVIAARIVGALRARADVLPALHQAMPAAGRFERKSDDTYAALDASAGELIGYVAIGIANGYGGPMRVAVATDPEGTILNVVIIEHRETPSYLNRVLRTNLLSSLIGRTSTDPIYPGDDIDAVSGATYTTEAIANAVREGTREIARQGLGADIPQASTPQIEFGIPEIVLILLFAVGYIGHQRNFKYKGFLRWGSMLVGMVMLGFIYNRPLTLLYIDRFLLGYWPQWQTHLYWYILIGGILFVFTVDNKNPYCEWFCPFGAVQECLGAIGGAKTRSAGRYRSLLEWVQRSAAWAAIVVALAFCNPGITSYEVFGTLFKLVGSTIQFVLLGLVLVMALFIRRPWCTYLCPLRPVTDLIRMYRTWAKELWQQLCQKRKAAV